MTKQGDRRRPDGAAGARRYAAPGFTLVEILIGIAISGVVGAALIGVLQDQKIFYEENSRIVTAQQSIRAAADRLSRELRMVRKGAVETAQADRLVVRYPVALGAVCSASPGQASVFMHRIPAAGTSPNTVRYLDPRYNGNWQTGSGWSFTSGSTTAESDCEGVGAPKDTASDHYQRIKGLSSSLTLDRGTMIRGTVPVEYEFADRGGEIVLLREGRRLAGPFQESQRYFRYSEQDGTTASNTDDIAYVRVDAVALGHEPSARYDGARRIDIRVPFRN